MGQQQSSPEVLINCKSVASVRVCILFGRDKEPGRSCSPAWSGHSLAPEAAGVRVALASATLAIPSRPLLLAHAPFCQPTTDNSCTPSGSSGRGWRQQAGGRHRPPALLHSPSRCSRSSALVFSLVQRSGKET